TSTMRFKKSDKSAREIAGALGASHVVEGSVRRAGKKLRIVAQLIEAASEATLWTETFDRDLADVFAVQSEVALSVASALRATLTATERALLRVTHDVNVEAYDCYLLGMHHWNRFSLDGIRLAGDYFNRALALDPEFAPAHAGLANYHLMLGGAPLNVVPAAKAMPEAKRAAERALQLNPANGPALEALALVQCWFERDWA